MSETCPTHNITYVFPETCFGCEISAQAYRQGYIDGAINALNTSSQNSDKPRASHNHDKEATT